MTNGVNEIQIEMVFKEMTAESFLCKYDGGLVIFKHDKFFLSRDNTTGIVMAQCARCDALYQIQDGKLKESH